MAGLFSKAKKYMGDPKYRFIIKRNKGEYDSLGDEEFIRKQFKAYMGYELDLDHPKTFNEKLQWIKLYDRQEIYTSMADKYEVKKIVADRIGEEYIIPTIGVWDNASDIDFEALPEQFVLKATHDSHGVVICKDKDKLDIPEAVKKLDEAMHRNWFLKFREWSYKNIRPRIIAETFMVDEKLGELRDYKFFCFNGKVCCFKVDFDRYIDHRANYFDPDGNLMEFGEVVCPPDHSRTIELPEDLEKMKELAETLASGIPFVRVDLYYVNGKIYFGEMTFFPASGLGKFIPENYDAVLGEWLTLPEKPENEK